jgi:hypothetical protein
LAFPLAFALLVVIPEGNLRLLRIAAKLSSSLYPLAVRLPSRDAVRPILQMKLPARTRVSCRLICWPALFCVLALQPVSLGAQNQQGLRPWERTTPAPATAPGAATLPATPPTSQPKPNAVPIAATPVANTTPIHRAEVTYSDGLLNVRSNNSSLHQILRAISRRTGMTITGGIADDRVFGDYGPAEPSSVLATLIDGTGVNMLFRAGDATHPSELVLTPQAGGGRAQVDNSPIGSDADEPPEPPTPAIQQPQPAPVPTANSSAGANPPATTAPTTSQITTPPSIPQPLNNVNGSSANTSPTASTLPTTHSVPIDSIPTPSTTPSSSGIVDAPNPPPPGSTTATSPNGVKTPEQIYQQLLQMQQQQSKPAAPATTTPPQ